MAEEGNLGIGRAQDTSDDEQSKAELQRRMDEARDSISQTVTEIKDSVVHQYESVRESISETLDWREQFRKRPIAWAAGAAGAGFLTGYCVTSMIKGDGLIMNGEVVGTTFRDTIKRPRRRRTIERRVIRRSLLQHRRRSHRCLRKRRVKTRVRD